MSNISTSDQYQELTTSQEGRNLMPLLQPKSHFFLSDGNFYQAINKGFGAVSEEKFRTTNTITFTGDKDVFAICKGTIFLQPQEGDDTKVNLILKPFNQPITNVAIKYIVYKGLNDNVLEVEKFVLATGISEKDKK